MNKTIEKTKKFLTRNKKPRVDFDRTPLLERLKLKILSARFLQQVVWVLFRFILLVGISYVILFPFFVKISASFMSPADYTDVTVRLIPKYPTLDTYKAIIVENRYFEAMFNTAVLSLLCAVVQTCICSIVGYGFAKFKFKGRGILFLCVIVTMIVPHETLMLSMFMKFRYFDVFGIYGFINEIFGFTKDGFFNLINTYWPLAILSIGGLAFKNGLYIFMMRQFYRGVPDELEEAAYIDGSGVFKTFARIIVPISIPMMITIFLFAFSWQWTDSFYSTLFFTKQGIYLMPNIVDVPRSLTTAFAASSLYTSGIRNTCGLLILLPLLIVYLFCQRYLIQGIERSGIVG